MKYLVSLLLTVTLSRIFGPYIGIEKTRIFLFLFLFFIVVWASYEVFFKEIDPESELMPKFVERVTKDKKDLSKNLKTTISYYRDVIRFFRKRYKAMTRGHWKSAYYISTLKRRRGIIKGVKNCKKLLTKLEASI